MENIIGIVVNKDTQTGNRKDGKGKWTRYAFQFKDAIGNVEWYSCFDQSAREIEVGTAYEFAYEVNGDYKNLETWMIVDADAHGLSIDAYGDREHGSMSTPVVANHDEFRRSKEEMRWTEAYHMATRIMSSKELPDSKDVFYKSELQEWAEFFYAKLADCNDHEVTRSRDDTANTPTAPETPVEAPVEERVVKTPRKPRSTPKKAVEVPEAITTAPDYNLLKAFNDARVKAIMTMEYVNEYIEKTYKVDTVRKLSEVQLKDVIRHIEQEMK